MSEPAEQIVAIAPPMASTMPKAGDVLAGKYVVEHVLGIGGMGIVVAARHISLDERFAIKLLLPEALAREGSRPGDPLHQQEVAARFLREGRAAIKIRSEHVVRIHDVDTLESGAPFMVMEYLDGRDLEAVIEADGPMAIPRAVDLLLQACEAIAEAHALGIVHRDLKPANLFLTHRADGSPAIKVLDFGISKAAPVVGRRESRITNTSAIMGSPEYMSPEQLRSTRDVDARTDVWALGVILHELLTGAPPFNGTTMPEICANILKEPPAALRTVRVDVPEELEKLILRCLEKDVTRRVANVAELASALSQFGSDLAVASADRIMRVLHVAPSEGDGVRRSGMRRSAVSLQLKDSGRRTVTWAIFAGVLLGAIGGGGYVVHQQYERATVVHVTSSDVPVRAPMDAPAEPMTSPPALVPEPPPATTAHVPAGAESVTTPIVVAHRSSPRPATPIFTNPAPAPEPAAAPAKTDDTGLFDDRK